MTKNTSFKFSDVITRLPANSVVDGLREGDGVNPNADVFSTQHANYLDVLRSINVATTVLPPLEQYPDSVFVEDAALVIGDTAILLHPGAPSRTGEAIEIKPVLAKHFRQVIELPQASGSSAAYVDGGDILIAETEVFAGLSARTNLRRFYILKQPVDCLMLKQFLQPRI